eukprot:scaffold166917_cov58-Attheya_sp.AAC.2
MSERFNAPARSSGESYDIFRMLWERRWIGEMKEKTAYRSTSHGNIKVNGVARDLVIIVAVVGLIIIMIRVFQGTMVIVSPYLLWMLNQ